MVHTDLWVLVPHDDEARVAANPETAPNDRVADHQDLLCEGKNCKSYLSAISQGSEPWKLSLGCTLLIRFCYDYAHRKIAVLFDLYLPLSVYCIPGHGYWSQRIGTAIRSN